MLRKIKTRQLGGVQTNGAENQEPVVLPHVYPFCFPFSRCARPASASRNSSHSTCVTQLKQFDSYCSIHFAQVTSPTSHHLACHSNQLTQIMLPNSFHPHHIISLISLNWPHPTHVAQPTLVNPPHPIQTTQFISNNCCCSTLPSARAPHPPHPTQFISHYSFHLIQLTSLDSPHSTITPQLNFLNSLPMTGFAVSPCLWKAILHWYRTYANTSDVQVRWEENHCTSCIDNSLIFRVKPNKFYDGLRYKRSNWSEIQGMLAKTKKPVNV